MNPRGADLLQNDYALGGFPEKSLGGAIAIYDNPTDLLTHYADSPFQGETNS